MDKITSTFVLPVASILWLYFVWDFDKDMIQYNFAKIAKLQSFNLTKKVENN